MVYLRYETWFFFLLYLDQEELMQYIPLMQKVSIKCQNWTTAVCKRIGSGGFQCQELEVICQIPLYFLLAFSYLLAKKKAFLAISTNEY